MEGEKHRSYLFVAIAPAVLTDRLFHSKARNPSGKHVFDKLCQALGIEQRLIPPLFPLDTLKPMAWWNATMDVLAILKTHHFDSSLDMERTLKHYVLPLQLPFPLR